MATSEMTGETSAQSVEEPSGMSEEGGTSSAIENRIKLVSIEIKRVELVRLSQKNGSKANVTHDILVYLSDSSRYPESSENEIVAMFWVDAQAKGRQVSESEGLALFEEWQRSAPIDTIIKTKNAQTARTETSLIEPGSPDRQPASVPFTNDSPSMAVLPGLVGEERIGDKIPSTDISKAQIGGVRQNTACDHDRFEPISNVHQLGHDELEMQSEINVLNSVVAGGVGGKGNCKLEIGHEMKTSNKDTRVAQRQRLSSMPKHSTAGGHSILSSSTSGLGQADGASPPSLTKNAPGNNHVTSPKPTESISPIDEVGDDSKRMKEGSNLNDEDEIQFEISLLQFGIGMVVVIGCSFFAVTRRTLWR